MLPAANEMDQSIGSLANRKVTGRLGIAKVHRERAAIDCLHFTFGAVIADRTDAGPAIAFVERQRAE